jgi:hypothetical protein
LQRARSGSLAKLSSRASWIGVPLVFTGVLVVLVIIGAVLLIGR